MAPKVIHYCWFGGNPLPKSAKKCIESWEKFFPDYQIKEWNENNYDVKKIKYIEQAYDAKKYAFVSDYARFDILYYEGGIYFDTDVEVIKSFDDILLNGNFMGCEIDGDGCSNSPIMVNPGLGLSADKGSAIMKKIMDYYCTQSFLNADGQINTETVVTRVTNLLKQYGLKNSSNIQKIGDYTIYPKEFFNPKDSKTGRLCITENTHSIHWYDMTWMSSRKRLRKKLLDPIRRIFGENCFSFLKKH